MARRIARSGIPLEWKSDIVTTSDATVTNGEIDLDLLPDEIAEIWRIDSTIEIANIPDAANDDINVVTYMSMDPDAIGNPATVATIEDLETFFYHSYHLQIEIGAAGATTLRNSDNKQLVLPEKFPLLVGTNLSHVVLGDAAIAVSFVKTIYFKRRKANAMELNQILLKRR